MLPFEHTWLPYIYLYVVGGIFFAIGMYVIKKSGAVNLAKKRHRFWWKVLIYGFVFFMVLHAAMILLALYT